MDTKIYTPSAKRLNKNEINLQQISNENDIKKYLSYVYQEYGDIYELNLIKDENSDTLTSEIPKSPSMPADVSQQSSCNIFCAICVYFLYIAATSAISGGLAYVAAFLLFNTNFKIPLTIAFFVLIEIVFLAGIPLVKKIKSTCSAKNETVYDI